MKPIVAIAHLVLILSNMMTPRWQSAAAMMNEGMRKAAMAEAATFG
jgi:hypothetical protein